MGGMGIGHEIWHREGMKWAWIWGMDNIKKDLQEIGRQSLDLVQDRKGGGLFKII
jgi:hypothetical protein